MREGGRNTRIDRKQKGIDIAWKSVSGRTSKGEYEGWEKQVIQGVT